MVDHASNLRRLMARLGLTVDQVAQQSGLDVRTVRRILQGDTVPHARTIQKLAAGLGVSSDELFQDPSLLLHKLFDRQTNPLIEQVVDSQGDLFRGWTEAEFDELYSRFGTGGGLTAEGVIGAARSMNRSRRIHRKVALIMESGDADLLVELVNLLYQRISIKID